MRPWANDGTMNVSSGGMDSFSVVKAGGTLNVSAGGVVSGTSISGGTLNVYSGGTPTPLTRQRRRHA